MLAWFALVDLIVSKEHNLDPSFPKLLLLFTRKEEPSAKMRATDNQDSTSNQLETNKQPGTLDFPPDNALFGF